MKFPGLGIAAGGVLMTLLFIPFTLAHGPTSFNEEKVVLGLDMLGWGFAMGVVPNMLMTGLAGCLWIGLVLAMVPMETRDGFNGYRITRTIMCGAVGLLWAAFGLSVALCCHRAWGGPCAELSRPR